MANVAMVGADARVRPGRRRARPVRRASGTAPAIGLGLLGALFFSSSFIVNRLLAVDGGAWEWTASLRFLLSLPIFFAIVAARPSRGGLAPVFQALRAAPGRWMLWSTVGFGLFYAPLCLAATTAPGWMIAASWQVTIVCGMFLAPFLYAAGDRRRRIPAKGVTLSGLILAGVFVAQLGGDQKPSWAMLGGIALVLFAAVAYPVGNRRTMELAGDRLDSFQRLLAMSLASLPLWLVLGLIGGLRAGLPATGQLTGTAVVAVCSGVIATSLFFAATQRVRDDPLRLAAVEATQAGEVVFVALLEPVILAAHPPGPAAWAGILAITVGVALYALTGRDAPSNGPRDAPSDAPRAAPGDAPRAAGPGGTQG
ncbi:multidrug resistance efflux transporter family protein [Actinomadura barringtoniae]|uniref:Multidrug resistance efflux transporter family protein n=1 Tax=Actinomadura barringtoniae TaxID=1427535 RepID=A0A939PK42_9ACTN|nr:multidrug resistance efflux transporter family protein [Actinomadura barringtoniae]MBO2453598.1 multidrug resistance efflux transporter family protein [Actinomadura barringtoniae]